MQRRVTRNRAMTQAGERSAATMLFKYVGDLPLQLYAMVLTFHLWRPWSGVRKNNGGALRVRQGDYCFSKRSSIITGI